VVKLLATDLDGTLLLPDATVSPRVAAAIAAAEDAGIEVVILTARSWRSLRLLAQDAIPRGIAVCSNGAVVYDLATDEIVRTHHIEPATLRAFLARASEELDVAIAWETARRVFRTQRYHELRGSDHLPAAYVASIEFAEDIGDDHEVTKVLVGHASLSPDELFAALAPFADGVTTTVSGGPFVEVMAAGVTKALALAAICDERGIDAADVVAVGDHTNDLPMLRWAGRGIAMGNAHPSVLAEIEEHTASNVDDGLALVIEGLLA
jgi:Cof subfamily protein (haloacid dehalogenase superfamily)